MSANFTESVVEEAAHRFRAWLADWRATAAVTITRRDHLISLGLAARRTPSGEVEDDSVEPELAPEPELPAADPILD
jgi:hypothetical protein